MVTRQTPSARARKPSQADRIRAARRRWPKLTPAQLAVKLRVSDGAVRSALRSSDRGRGRPPGDRVRVEVMLDRELADSARALADADAATLAEWIGQCVLATVRQSDG